MKKLLLTTAAMVSGAAAAIFYTMRELDALTLFDDAEQEQNCRAAT